MIYDGQKPIDFIHQEVNTCYESMTGLKNITGRKATEVFPDIEKLYPDFIEKQVRVAQSGIPDRFEIYLEPFSSWFDISVYSPKKGYFVSMIDNITERKKAEQDLRESESRFRKLFQNHSASMMVIDPDSGNIIDANPAAANFYGWSIEELCRMSIMQINTLPPERVRAEMEKSRSCAQNHFSFRHRRANGSIRDVDVFCNKIEIAEKVFLYSIIHDITERTRYEFLITFRLRILQMAETSTVEELLQTTLDEAERLTQSSIGFVFFVAKDQASLSLQLCTKNPLENICPTAVKGEPYSLDKAGIWADAVRERRSILHNDYPSLTNQHRVAAGDTEVTRLLVVPVIRDDRVVAIMGIGNKPENYDDNDLSWVDILANLTWDIVAKKIVDEEREILEHQLQHSKKMEMVGQLAAGIAHEINNPLNFIAINFANIQAVTTDLQEMLKEYQNVARKLEAGTFSDDDLQRLRQKEVELALDTLVTDIPEILVESQRGFERISSIIHSMRNLSNQHAIEKKIPFNINKGITDTLVVTHHEYSLCADVETTLGELPVVLCNPEQICQVLLNMIINSVHAIQSQQRSSKGSIHIHTWFDSSNVYCSIADDGPGIPHGIKNDIFNPFFTTKSHGKGTGLGLSISFDIIVIKHNGKISVENPVSGGTVFTFSLPIQIP